MADQDKKLSAKELENIGQMMVSITETGYANRKRFYKMSFIKGVVTGFGTVLGATVVVALLLWILSLFDSIWFIENLKSTIEASGPK